MTEPGRHAIRFDSPVADRDEPIELFVDVPGSSLIDLTRYFLPPE